MSRDFTYVDDLVNSIHLLLDVRPAFGQAGDCKLGVDNKSPVAPFRIVNIGNSKPKKLMDLIETIEKTLGIVAKKNLVPMQDGDVPATWADTTLQVELTGDQPEPVFQGR